MMNRWRHKLGYSLSYNRVLFSNKNAQTTDINRKSPYYRIPLIRSSRRNKTHLWQKKSEHWLPLKVEGGTWLQRSKKILKILPGNESVLYLDAGGDFMGIYIYQYSRIVQYTRIVLKICALYIIASSFQKLGNFQNIHSNLQIQRDLQDPEKARDPPKVTQQGGAGGRARTQPPPNLSNCSTLRGPRPGNEKKGGRQKKGME